MHSLLISVKTQSLIVALFYNIELLQVRVDFRVPTGGKSIYECLLFHWEWMGNISTLRIIALFAFVCNTSNKKENTLYKDFYIGCLYLFIFIRLSFCPCILFFFTLTLLSSYSVLTVFFYFIKSESSRCIGGHSTHYQPACNPLFNGIKWCRFAPMGAYPERRRHPGKCNLKFLRDFIFSSY